MEIKSLPQEVRSQLRNGTNINNVTQCVTELVSFIFTLNYNNIV